MTDYSMKKLRETFLDHAARSKKDEEERSAILKEINPDYVENQDDFSLPKALAAMCEAIISIQSKKNNLGLMMDWIKVDRDSPNFNEMIFLSHGDSVYIRGTELNPFFMQLSGEIRSMGDIKYDHWMPFPKPPISQHNN